MTRDMSVPAAAQSRFARGWRPVAQLTRTVSKRLMLFTILANTYGIGRNWPGQVAWLCGHESQIASCGSHSAGIRNPSFAGVSILNFRFWIFDWFMGRARPLGAPFCFG